MRGLRGKAAIVTGAAQGIGKAIAERLTEEGCKVLWVDIDAEKVIQAQMKTGKGLAMKACFLPLACYTLSNVSRKGISVHDMYLTYCRATCYTAGRHLKGGRGLQNGCKG